MKKIIYVLGIMVLIGFISCNTGTKKQNSEASEDVKQEEILKPNEKFKDYIGKSFRHDLAREHYEIEGYEWYGRKDINRETIEEAGLIWLGAKDPQIYVSTISADDIAVDFLEIEYPTHGLQGIHCWHCKVNGEDDANILVIYQADNESAFYTEQWFDNIIKAWKIDEKTGFFKEISTEGISCLNEAYGI